MIDFGRIRVYDGAQTGGFEQLAVEMFARRNGVSRQLFLVNGTGGDGGVEAYVKVSGSGEIGMQAKYLLDEPKWPQIDRSVKRALQQHPELLEYHVYIPLDRTQGRLGETEGHVEQWNQYVDAWHALPNGAKVEFVWQGRCEIELELKRPANHGLLFYCSMLPVENLRL